MSLEQQLDRLCNAIEENNRLLAGGKAAEDGTPAKPGKAAKAAKIVAKGKAVVEDDEDEDDDGMGDEEEESDGPTPEDAKAALIEVKAKVSREASKDIMKTLKIESANEIPQEKVAKVLKLCKAALAE
jgi:hypothetical protein